VSTPTSHETGPLPQDGGELPVDVALREAPNDSGRPANPHSSGLPGGDPDEADEESFPASDPPSAWAGPDESTPETRLG